MEKDNALQILNSRKLISAPGKYNLKTTSSTFFEREDGTQTHIVGLAAMTPYHLTQAKSLFKEEKFQEATNQQLSSSQRIERDYVPSKGEFVDVVVDYITNNDNIQILAVVSLTAMKTSKAAAINFSEVEETVEEAPLA